MEKGKEIFLYKGHVDFDVIGDIYVALKEKMADSGVQVTIYKKVLSVLVETLENIARYYDQIKVFISGSTDYFPEISVFQSKDKYIVSSKNPILFKDVEPMRNMIDWLNHLDKVELKNLFKSIIKNGKRSQNGGAGLGFVVIARVSPDQIKYRFKKLNDTYYSFKMTIAIPIEQGLDRA